MCRKFVSFASLAALVLVVILPSEAVAQVDAAGSWKVTFSGGGTLGKNTNLTNIIGLSRFTESGLELGGNILASFSTSQRQGTCDEYDSYSGDCRSFSTVSDVSVDGFGFFRATYNFIGESLTVPFVTAGFGVPLKTFEENESGYSLIDFGGGFKRFFNERASFDVSLTYQAILREGGGEGSLSVLYGMSMYF